MTTSKLLLRLVPYLVAAAFIWWLVTSPVTPFTQFAAVVVIVVALYSKSVYWRKVKERNAARTAAILGESPDQLRAFLRDVEPLLKGDPVAAQRAFEAHFRPQRERTRAEREQLWQRAGVERAAAAQLDRTLRDDLAAHRAALATVQKMVSRSPGMAPLVGEMEAEIIRTEQDITKVGHFLRRIGDDANGAA